MMQYVKLPFMSKIKINETTLQMKFRRKRRLDGARSFTKINVFRRTALLVSFMLLQGFVVVSSIEYHSLCHLEITPVKVTIDHVEPEHDELAEVNDDDITYDNDNPENRNLRVANKKIIKSILSRTERPRELIKWKLVDGSETNSPTVRREEYLVRRCLCGEVKNNTFCPVDNNANACAVPKNSSDPTLCYRTSSHLTFIRKSWPIVILWFGAMLVFLVTTDHGRNVRNFIMSKMFPNWNDATIDRIVRRETEVRNLLRRSHLRNRSRIISRRTHTSFHNSSFVGDGSGDWYDQNQRRILVLKTKRYHSPKCPSTVFTSNLDGGPIDPGYSTPDNEYDHTDDSERTTTESEAMPPSPSNKSLERNRPEKLCLKDVETTPIQSLETPMTVNTNFSEDLSLASALSPPSRLCSPDSVRTNPDHTDTMRSMETPYDDSIPQNSDGLSISDSCSIADTDSSVFCPPCEVHSDLQTSSHGDIEKAENKSNHDVGDDGEDNGFDSESDFNDGYCKDEVVCTICIMELKDGDRIGALPCYHSFHVDCLKEWIKRKNVCPLCQEPNIASVRREPITATATVVDNLNADDTDDADNTDPRARSTARQDARESVRTSLFTTNHADRAHVDGSSTLLQMSGERSTGSSRSRRRTHSLVQVMRGQNGSTVSLYNPNRPIASSPSVVVSRSRVGINGQSASIRVRSRRRRRRR